MPTRIIYRKYVTKDLESVFWKKTLLITSKFPTSGLVDRIRSLSKNIEFVVSDIKSHPEFKDLKKFITNLSK